MSSTEERKPQPPDNLSMYLAGLVAIVVLGPTVLIHFVAFDASFSWTHIVAMIWFYMADTYGSVLITVLTQPFFFLLLPLLVIPRLYFISMINKLYHEKTTRKRVVRIGIFAELWLPLLYSMLYLPFVVIAPDIIGGIPITVPIPFLLLAGMYLLRRKPARGMPSTWTEEDDSLGWWEEQSMASKTGHSNLLRHQISPFYTSFPWWGY